jgi:hypothetical protein
VEGINASHTRHLTAPDHPHGDLVIGDAQPGGCVRVAWRVTREPRPDRPADHAEQPGELGRVGVGESGGAGRRDPLGIDRVLVAAGVVSPTPLVICTKNGYPGAVPRRLARRVP